MSILTKIWLKIKKISYFNKKSDSVFRVKKLITLSFLTVLPFISACEYLNINKCIEADDFGENQIEFLEVKSNNLEDKCQFDVKYLSDPLTEDAKLNGQFGENIKKCLFINNGMIFYYDSKTYYFNGGCAGINNTTDGITDDNRSSIREMCISNCKIDCIKGDSTTTAKPDWQYTSSSLILSPETPIKITAVGSVNLRSLVAEGISGTFSPKNPRPNISTSLDRKAGEDFSLFLKGGYKVTKIGDSSNPTYYYGTDQVKGNVDGDCISPNCVIKPITSFARRTLIYAKTDKSKINVKNKEEWQQNLFPDIDYLYKYGGKLTNSLSKDPDYKYKTDCDSASCKLIIINAKTSLKLEIKSTKNEVLSGIIYNKITKDQEDRKYYVEKKISIGKDFKPIDIVNSEDSISITNSKDIEFKATSLPFKVRGATQVQKSGFLYFSYLRYVDLITRKIDDTPIKIPLTIAFPSSTKYHPTIDFVVASSKDVKTYSNWSGGYFIKKGSAFIPDYSSLLNSDVDIDKINNMAFAIDHHRPAVFCSNVNETKLESNKNPDCINSVIDRNTGEPSGCQDQPDLCDDITTDYYCPYTCKGFIMEERKFIDYMVCNPVTGESKMSCSIKDSSGASLFNYIEDGKISITKDIWTSEPCLKCESCFKERYKQATAPYYIDSQLDQCYDIEEYNDHYTNFLTETDSVKDSYKIKEFNGYYGSLGDLDRDVKCSTSSDTSSSPTAMNKLSCSGYYKLVKSISTEEDASIEFLTLGESLPDNNSYSPDDSSYKFSDNNVSFSTFDTKTTYRNGEMLEVKLVTDTSELKPSIINYKSSSSTISSIQTIAPESAYNFDQSGYLTRILSFEDASTKNACSTNTCYDCTVEKNSIANLVNHKYMCHTVGVKYDSSGNQIKDKDSRHDESLIEKVKLGFKIKDPDEKDSDLTTDLYSDNMGSYLVKVELKKTTNFGADLIKSIITPVLEYVDGTYKIVDGKEVKVKDSMFEYHYKRLIADYRYKLLLNTCLMMFVMFYGLGYIIGISKLNHIELIHRVIKIGIIYVFVGEYGWEWFQAIFVTGFKDGVDYLVFNMASVFDNSPKLSSAIDKNYFRDKSILFSSSDAIFKMIFSDPVIFKILALLSASLFGFVYLTILGYGLMLYIYAISNATLIYLTAQFFISILFLLAPIFFILLLFAPTKEIFDNWIKHMIGLSFQQIFVLITIALFNEILYEVIKGSLGYRVCWDEVWIVKVGGIRFSLLSFWTVPAFAPRETINIDLSNLNTQPIEGLPSLFKILSIWAIASLMKHFVTLSAEIGGKIGDLSPGGMSAVNLSKDVAQHFGKKFDWLKKKASKIGSFAHNKTIGRLGDKINDKLFDYGKIAEARKAKEGKENKKIDNKVQALINAGDVAVQRAKEDYLESKINVEKGIPNSGDRKKYEDMDQEKFNEGLSKIRNDAIDGKFEEIKEFEKINRNDRSLTKKDEEKEIQNILYQAKSGSVRNRFNGNMFYDISKAMINSAKARSGEDNKLKTRDIDNFALNKKSEGRKQEAGEKEKQFMENKSSSEFSKEMYQKIGKPAINLVDDIANSFDFLNTLRPRVLSKDEKDIVRVKTGDEQMDNALKKQLEERKSISKKAK